MRASKLKVVIAIAIAAYEFGGIRKGSGVPADCNGSLAGIMYPTTFNNTFYANHSIKFGCGVGGLSGWQAAVGQDLGSVQKPMPTDEQILELGRKLLGF